MLNIQGESIYQAKKRGRGRCRFQSHEEIENVADKFMEYVNPRRKNKRRKLVAIGTGKVLKEGSRDIAVCTRTTACEDGCLQVNLSDSRQLPEGSATKDFQSIFSGAAVDAKKSDKSTSMRYKGMQESTLRNGEIKDACRVQSTDNSKSLARDGIGASGCTAGDEHCPRDGFHTSQLQCYQRRLHKGRDTKTPLNSASKPRAQTWCKSISKLDLSRSMSCSPSYRLLPMKYLRQASQLHPLRAQVLNDHWVCVPSGSQNYNLRRTKRNLYEEKLQECEDDCCELDVLLESTRAAIRRMEELLIRLGSGKKVSLDDHLTVMDWHCCDRLHDEYGLEFEDMIRKDPCTALPLVIDKLKQKEEELITTREGFSKSLKEAFSDECKSSLTNAKSGAKKGLLTQLIPEKGSLPCKRT